MIGEKMRIAKYQYKDKECYGIMQPEKLLCLPDLAKNYEVDLPNTIEDFIESTTARKMQRDCLPKLQSLNMMHFLYP